MWQTIPDNRSNTFNRKQNSKKHSSSAKNNIIKFQVIHYMHTVQEVSYVVLTLI